MSYIIEMNIKILLGICFTLSLKGRCQMYKKLN